MRDYSVVSPRFWIGSTGRKIRAMGRDCQVLALYLVTSPHANMLGFYYLPANVISHETGIPLEGTLKALRSLSEADFAHYDPDSEHVWVVEMARFQIAEELKATDNRVKGIQKELEGMRKCPFSKEFWNKYHKAFCLKPIPGLVPGLEAPSKPHRSQEQEQEQEQEQDTKTPLPPLDRSTPPEPAAKCQPEMIPIPDELDTPEFHAAWTRWIAHLRDKSNGRLSQQSLQANLFMFARAGPQRAIDVIEKSILNHWTYLDFNDKPNGKRTQSRQNTGRAGDARERRL